jgi:hypothetical protein
VADDQTLTPIDGGIEPGVPVFGRRTGSFDQRKFRRFALEIESDSERFNATFEAFVDADAGAILGLMNARTEWQQANATAVLLGTSLRDDDGVPDDWSSPTEPEYDDDGELLRLPEDDPDVSPPPPGTSGTTASCSPRPSYATPSTSSTCSPRAPPAADSAGSCNPLGTGCSSRR